MSEYTCKETLKNVDKARRIISDRAKQAVYHHEHCRICGATYEAKGFRDGRVNIEFRITGPSGGCPHEKEVMKWLKRKCDGFKDWRGPNWKQPND